MFKKQIIVSVFLTMVVNNAVFSQAVNIDTALSNATNEISESVPQGTRIAILSISSEYVNFSDYIINELIANLVAKRLFQIVPRSAVEIEAVNMELGFQMSGFVSDESAKSIGQFLGAGTIITGSVTRDSGNTYRLVVNAIDVESFTFQSTYRVSIQDNRQVQALTGNFYEDYTFGERMGIGALNIFGGAGSIRKGERIGWVITGIQGGGLVSLVIGLALNSTYTGETYDPNTGYSSSALSIYDVPAWEARRADVKVGLVTAGSIMIGTGVLFGFIIPFFHEKPNSAIVAQNNFPFNFELVSSNNYNINGLRLLYNMSF